MKNENDISSEELEETDADLKKVRESKAITLRDLFKSTRIRIPILEAIEKEEFHLLPEPVYARIFIKVYAKEVGVDSEKILSRYEKYLEQNKIPRKEEVVRKRSWLESHLGLLGWILSILFVVVFLVIFLYPNHKSEPEVTEGSTGKDINKSVTEEKPYDESRSEENIKKETVDKVSTQAEVNESEIQTTHDEQATKQEIEVKDRTGVNQDIADKQADVSEAAYELIIKANELVWLNMTADHNPPHEILLRPGEKIYKKASRGFTIDIGNAGGVDVLFQGESLGILGKHGEVIHLTLPEVIEHRR
jgi:cytoskeleton protein RodZ